MKLAALLAGILVLCAFSCRVEHNSARADEQAPAYHWDRRQYSMDLDGPSLFENDEAVRYRDGNGLQCKRKVQP